jgi:hypothetical protein
MHAGVPEGGAYFRGQFCRRATVIVGDAAGGNFRRQPPAC